MNDPTRALVDIQANARLLYTLVANKDPEAKRIVNLILQDAYVIKDALNRDESTRSYVDARGVEGCKATPMIYAHFHED